MKHLFRTHRLAALLLMCATGFHATAQAPITPPDTGGISAPIPYQQYTVAITGDFESKCLLNGVGHFYHDELSNAIVACQGQEVTYTAHASTGLDNVVSWSWSVVGATSVSSNNNVATVLWGTDATGELSVTITTASGRTYTFSQTVYLIERPIAAATSVPAYDPDHVIYVCYGMDVAFTDQSHTENSDIAGYRWEGCGHSSSSRSFLLNSVTAPCTVTHRVYNNCGCYDEEQFFIHVLEGDPLKISCYGTVCEGSTATYHALSPVCSQYFWSVEGGHIVDGQGTSDITVTWDSPLDGYGTISLDGTLCSQSACQSSLSVRIPIIQDGVTISGQSEACVGEAVMYSVPLYGSTRYVWNITPTAGVDSTPVNQANKMTYKFTAPGTYTISVRYKCDFLACGEFSAESLTVVVRPRLAILGDREVCLSNPATLTTNADPADNLVTWKVYDIDNGGQPVYSSPTPAALLSSSVIASAGRYRVTAENASYCSEASFILTVKDPPPSPTVAEMDPDNPSVACLNSSILLKATPTNPLYNVLWEPVCSTSTLSGTEVTVNYGSEVCDVNAYYYDRQLQCRSTLPYTHHVEPFVLAQTHLPETLTVCPGTRIVWDDDIVPDQEGVLYEWQMEDHYQHCATIEGSIHSGPNTLLINDINYTLSNTIGFDVYLFRRYCAMADTDTVRIFIFPLQTPALSITAPTAVCQHNQVQLSGSGCGGTGTLMWHFSDNNHSATGTPVSHTFDHPGDILVTLTCNPYDACGNSRYLPSVSQAVRVIPVPPAHSIGYDGNDVFIEPPLDPSLYDFIWTPTAPNSNRVTATPDITNYSCLVVSRTTPSCTTTVENEVELCDSLKLSSLGIDYCKKEVSFAVAAPPAALEWTVLEGGGSPTISGTLNENATIPVSTMGNLVVSVRTKTDPCHSATRLFAVDFLPFFSLENACSAIVIHNNSLYLDASKTIQIEVGDGNGIVYGHISCPVSQNTITYTYPGSGGHFEFTLVDYDGQPLRCLLGSTDITNSSGLLVDVTSANTVDETLTCDNTAILLTASLPSPYTIQQAHWDFDDHGTCLDAYGNSVYHTFRYESSNQQAQTLYNVTVNVTDENGCAHNGGLTIKSHKNCLKDASLEKLNFSNPLCPGNVVTIYYAASGSTPSCTATYNWSTSPFLSYVNTHETYYTDDYSVMVTNDNYCKTEASVNVPFKNQPSALIIPKKYHYCTGETVTLHGEPDLTNAYTYVWTVCLNGTNQCSSYTTGTVTFPAGNTGCSYTVNMTITNSEGCSAQADPVTITVVAPPTPPSIAIDPNQQCIDQYPVSVVGSDPSQSLYWSNGEQGSSAEYYYPGPALAYYYDLVSGCRSDSAIVTIPAAPDFDALLTGCYKVCNTLSITSLPVYGLLPWLQSYGWDWYYDYDPYATSPLGPQPSPLNLPLAGFGSYYLSVNYFGNCRADSEPLILQKGEPCRCDSVDISYVCKKIDVEKCHLVYEIDVTVCNNSMLARCFNKLTPLFDPLAGNISITSNTFSSTTIAAGNCYSFSLTLDVSALDPAVAAFSLVDKYCANCATDFSIDLMPEVDCTQLSTGQILPNGTLSDDNTIYCSFTLNVSGAANVLAVWSEPRRVVNHTLAGSTLNGLCAFRQADLPEDGMACVYALVCVNNSLCVYYCCVPAADLLETTKSARPGSRGDEGSATSPDPSLLPNPTTGDVSVVGTPDEVVEVLVMEMNGRGMAAFVNTDRFSISALPSGIYIVRVKTRHAPDATEKVSYLKLVKK